MASPNNPAAGKNELACPYFMPVEKCENGNWPHPARLPLGGGWRGHCTAPGHEGELPPPQTLETFCNLGYASGCTWAPREHFWDAVRFAVSAPPGAAKPAGNRDARPEVPVRILRLRYVCERNHLPVAHGDLEFDLARSTWLRGHDDPRLQKMAECFLDSYMKIRARKGIAMQGLTESAE